MYFFSAIKKTSKRIIKINAPLVPCGDKPNMFFAKLFIFSQITRI